MRYVVQSLHLTLHPSFPHCYNHGMVWGWPTLGVTLSSSEGAEVLQHLCPSGALPVINKAMRSTCKGHVPMEPDAHMVQPMSRGRERGKATAHKQDSHCCMPMMLYTEMCRDVCWCKRGSIDAILSYMQILYMPCLVPLHAVCPELMICNHGLRWWLNDHHVWNGEPAVPMWECRTCAAGECGNADWCWNAQGWSPTLTMDSYFMQCWIVGQALLFSFQPTWSSNIFIIICSIPCITYPCSTYIATLLHIWCCPYTYNRISFIH